MQLKNVLQHGVAVLLGGFLLSAFADEAPALAQLRAKLAERPTAVRPSAIDGYYGVYFGNGDPAAFVDADLNVYGNGVTGYRFLAGARGEKDLQPYESSQLFRKMLKGIKKDRLPTYRFGSGKKEIFLFTAYDCPNCRTLEREFAKRAKTLNATVYVVPMTLNGNASARQALHGVLCAPNRAAAWSSLVLDGVAPEEQDCAADPADYAVLPLAFPNAFPKSVPTAVTMNGRVYTMVLAAFNVIFAEP